MSFLFLHPSFLSPFLAIRITYGSLLPFMSSGPSQDPSPPLPPSGGPKSFFFPPIFPPRDSFPHPPLPFPCATASFGLPGLPPPPFAVSFLFLFSIVLPPFWRPGLLPPPPLEVSRSACQFRPDCALILFWCFFSVLSPIPALSFIPPIPPHRHRLVLFIFPFCLSSSCPFPTLPFLSAVSWSFLLVSLELRLHLIRV